MHLPSTSRLFFFFFFFFFFFAAVALVVFAAPTQASDRPEPRLLSGGAAGAIDTQGDARFTNWVYSSADTGSEVGVWQGHGRARSPGEAPTLNRDDYSELMFIVEGGVTLEEPGLKPLVLGPGDAVIVPRGVPYWWRLAETQWVKKYYVIFDKSDGAPSARHTHIVRLPRSGARDTASDPRPGPDGRATLYETPSGQRAGVASKGPPLAPSLAPRAFTEVAFIVEGAGALALPQGKALAFKAGDVVLAPRGSSYAWRGKDVVAYWVDFDGAPTAGATPRVLAPK